MEGHGTSSRSKRKTLGWALKEKLDNEKEEEQNKRRSGPRLADVRATGSGSMDGKLGGVWAERERTLLRPILDESSTIAELENEIERIQTTLTGILNESSESSQSALDPRGGGTRTLRKRGGTSAGRSGGREGEQAARQRLGRRSAYWRRPFEGQDASTRRTSSTERTAKTFGRRPGTLSPSDRRRFPPSPTGGLRQKATRTRQNC